MPRPLSMINISWPVLLMLTGMIVRTVRLRRRARALAEVEAGPPGTGEWRLVTAPGVRVTDEVLRAATGHAERTGAAALDLVPGGLDAQAALDLLNDVDPARYRENRGALGRTAGHALVIRAELARRAGVTAAVTEAADPIAFLRIVLRVKECAPTGLDFAVVPGGLDAVRTDPAWSAARLRTLGVPVALAFAWPPLLAVLVTATAVTAPVWVFAASIVLWLRPVLVLRRSALRPSDGVPGMVLRPVRYARGWVRAVAGYRHRSVYEPERPDLEALRTQYAAAVGNGVEGFFEPRRKDCPWCGSPELRVQARVGDLLQGKPGTFTLERCRGCGHVFQNPRLSPEGLDYYYRDFYDGVDAGGASRVMGSAYRAFVERAEAIRPYETPKAWLDVGGGAGQFCGIARELWPGTRFDVLDMSESVREGELLGRIDTGHLGQFPELADELAGRYDVVSMFHYLEHTRDPRAELAAAARVLPPGGHLLIEVPDPQAPQRLLFRSWWVCWFQPQHQHFVPAGNLREALAEHGFSVVAEEIGSVHSGGEFLALVAFARMRLAPDPRRPWDAGRPTVPRRALHRAARVGSLPFFLIALVMEKAGAKLFRSTGTGNAYRMLARREEPAT
ncbi:class I SAM-dependent methyltransferase [Actinomadura fulvescens]|uniref:Methyltransferase n=1 Tax=Actinomadura fulvescens TaxID=46160 RepID=A0ABN3PGK8_9ACTN